MKFGKIYIFAIALMLLFVQSCTVDSTIDLRERDYGYVQFKLYKSASYNGAASAQSRAVQTVLDYLSRVSKIGVTMVYNGETITQYLPVSAANDDAAEYGLRSDKLRLLVGDYAVMVLILYDNADKELFRMPVTTNNSFR